MWIHEIRTLPNILLVLGGDGFVDGLSELVQKGYGLSELVQKGYNILLAQPTTGRSSPKLDFVSKTIWLWKSLAGGLPTIHQQRVLFVRPREKYDQGSISRVLDAFNLLKTKSMIHVRHNETCNKRRRKA